MIKFLFLISILALSFKVSADTRTPQWTALFIETTEGGAPENYYKGSTLGYEKNYGKYFLSANLKKNSSEASSSNLYGISVGAQPDWEFAGEPRVSIGAGIGRGRSETVETRSSYLAMKGEIVFKLSTFVSASGGLTLTNIRYSKHSESGLSQETGLGFRILFY